MKTIAIISIIFVGTFHIYKIESCTTNQFECVDGQCIPREQRCDDNFDCTDRSDEVNCTYHDPNHCPEGLQRCYNDQCVADLNQCPTPTLIPTATEVSSISTSQLQASSLFLSNSVGIVATSSLFITKSSVIETTIASVESVTPTSDDHNPVTDNSNLLYLLFLLLFIPIGLAVCIVYNRSDKRKF
ncbi:uncharacterized protein LOC143075062 [Mytilus galloprovincialis]|uniref:uncharacterized protein LOC143075062 n=1 Tax=Mytilus galloprovincialis TaxID=29158 RepID=UPI003F7C6D3E